MLTEILLSVTDSEVENIAKEVYRKAKEAASKGSTWNKLFIPSITLSFMLHTFILHSKSIAPDKFVDFCFSNQKELIFF